MPAAKAASAAAASPAKRKLTFNDRHALKTLPKEIATLQSRIRGLQERLGDPALYARDRTAFTEATTALAAAQAELGTAEERWLELEMLREKIEGV